MNWEKYEKGNEFYHLIIQKNELCEKDEIYFKLKIGETNSYDGLIPLIPEFTFLLTSSAHERLLSYIISNYLDLHNIMKMCYVTGLKNGREQLQYEFINLLGLTGSE